MRQYVCSLVSVLMLVVATGGCSPELSPEEEIERLRAHYEVELKSLTVRQEPAVSAEEDAPEALDESEAPDGSEASEEAAVEVKTEVLLDILVSTNGETPLPGLTIDLTQVDSDLQEKGRRTLWIDTSDVVRGGGVQITHVLTDVDYVSGDGFNVEVRVPIPPAERAGYREFSP